MKIIFHQLKRNIGSLSVQDQFKTSLSFDVGILTHIEGEKEGHSDKGSYSFPHLLLGLWGNSFIYWGMLKQQWEMQKIEKVAFSLCFNRKLSVAMVKYTYYSLNQLYLREDTGAWLCMCGGKEVEIRRSTSHQFIPSSTQNYSADTPLP